MPELVIVLGSATPPGRLRAALEAGVERGGSGWTTTLVDLAEQRIAPADGRPAEQLDDDTAAVLAAIAAADAVVLATPVYRGSFTGVLKNLLDHVPVAALRGTPVGIVAQGASDHHFLGADRHLRDVLTFFGALVAPVSVYLSSADFDDGLPHERAAAEVASLLDALARLRSVAADGPFGPLPLTARSR